MYDQHRRQPASESTPRALDDIGGNETKSNNSHFLPSKPAKRNSQLEHRYTEALRSLPAPGLGLGCHGALLGIANLGIMAGKDPVKIQDDIWRSIPSGGRRVKDKEITDAINKALSDNQGGTFTPKMKPKPIVENGRAALMRIIEQSSISDDVELWEASPIRIHCLPEETAALLLSALFAPDDLVWIGERHQPGILGETIRTATEWIEFIESGDRPGPHIIINPLTGTPAPLKSGNGETMRGDGNVDAYRNCLVEFDCLSREEQIRFWSSARLPIKALIDSGGKSIHAWLDVQKLAKDISTPEQWQSIVKNRLYDQLLTPMGVDTACSNPARLSRLPGYFRQEKETMQRLLWLSEEGRTIHGS